MVKTRNILYFLLPGLIIGLLYSAQSYFYRAQIGQQVQAWDILLVDTPYFLFWAALAPLALLLARRLPFSKSSWWRFALVHFVAGAIVAFLHALVYNSYRLWVSPGESGFSFERIYLNAVASFDYGMLVWFVILLVVYTLDYYRHLQEQVRRNAELQSALVQSQLNALKMKLQPHFLFNTLNSIAVLIQENPVQATETLNRLSNLLRHVLQNIDDQFSTLDEEIAFTKQYLAIEQVRFGERLKIEYDLASGLGSQAVPALILQPLVENAVRHGIAQKSGAVLIRISATRDNGRLTLQVYDNGKGIQSGRQKSGMGLIITQDRLQSLYENEYAMQIEKATEGGTLATLRIPLAQGAQV